MRAPSNPKPIQQNVSTIIPFSLSVSSTGLVARTRHLHTDSDTCIQVSTPSGFAPTIVTDITQVNADGSEVHVLAIPPTALALLLWRYNKTLPLSRQSRPCNHHEPYLH